MPQFFQFFLNKMMWLKIQGSSFAATHNLYASWLYFTGNRSQPDMYFPEAADYPQLILSSGQDAAEEDLPALSMRHVLLSAEPNFLYRAGLSATSSGGLFNFLGTSSIVQSAVRFGSSQLLSPQDNGQIILIMTDSQESDLSGLKYSIRLSQPVLAQNPLLVKKEMQSVDFLNVPPFSTLRIFNLNGVLVQTIISDNMQFGKVSWNLKDRLGHWAASGIYLYQLRNKDSSFLGKFSVVRQ